MNKNSNTKEKNRKITIISGSASIILFIFIILLANIEMGLFPANLRILPEYFHFGEKVFEVELINVIFTVISGISTVICGIYADKIVRKTLLTGGCVLFSIFSLLVVFVSEGKPGYFTFLFFYAFCGIGIGALVPTIFSLVGDIAASDKRTIIMSYLTAAMLVGGLLGSIIGNIIVDSDGIWQFGYFYLGIICLIFGILLIFIEEPKRGSSEEELKQALAGAEYRYTFTKDDIKTLKSNKSNLWLIVNFIDTIPGALILQLIFVYLEEKHNLSGDIFSVTILLVGVFAFSGTLVFGVLGDKWFKKDKKAKVKIALFCNGFPVIFFFILLSLSFRVPDGFSFSDVSSEPQVIVILICLCMAMFINQGVGGNWYSTLIDVNLPEHRATMVSMAAAMDLIGKALGPFIGAWLFDHVSLTAGMYVAVVFWILNVFLWFPIFKHIETDLENVHTTLEQRAKEMEEKN